MTNAKRLLCWDTVTAAQEIGCAEKTIFGFCRAIGVPKLGKKYVIAEEWLAKIKAASHGKRGHPSKDWKPGD
jgi:hypothetical protein